MTHTSPTPEHVWRHREVMRTAVCGTLSFVLMISLLTFGGEHLTGLLSFFGIGGHKPSPEQVYLPVPAPSTHGAAPTVRKAVEPVRKQPLPASVLPESFPPFIGAMHPVDRVPNWGAMRTPAEWNRTYQQMQDSDFVAVPAYDLETLTIPTKELLKNRERNIRALTAKLYYSTRFFGTYSLDAKEYSGTHPGVDLKLAVGTPIGAIGGGRVYRVSEDENLGLHVVVEHRIPGEGPFFSIYGHLGTVAVREGQDVRPGTILGQVGMTGKTTAGHLHLQIDRLNGSEHTAFRATRGMTLEEALRATVHPLEFIAIHNGAALQIVEDTESRPIEVTGRQQTVVGG